jgi:hypothetical protein
LRINPLACKHFSAFSRRIPERRSHGMGTPKPYQAAIVPTLLVTGRPVSISVSGHCDAPKEGGR